MPPRREVEALIDELNADPACHGYIVQLPLPKHLDTDAILERIDPDKDADGLHPTNLGRLVLNVNNPITSPLPCTPRGVIELLDAQRLRPRRQARRGRRSRRHDRPLDRAAADPPRVQRDGHPHPHRHGRSRRITCGRPTSWWPPPGVKHIVRAEDVKPGAAVLDVGVTREDDPETGKSKVYGDVHPDVAEVAGYLSPNPGGVGPMTVALLMTNVVEAAERAVA